MRSSQAHARVGMILLSACVLVAWDASYGPGAAWADLPQDCMGLTVTLWGTNSDDFIMGTSERDVIALGTGDDGTRAGGGKDVVCANPGNDMSVYLGSGGDRANGGADRDWIFADPGDDTFYGGAGSDDVLFGDTGDDVIYGDLGNDGINGSDGVDNIAGNEDGDELFDGYRSDVVAGGDGYDFFYPCDDGARDRVSGVEWQDEPSQFYCT